MAIRDWREKRVRKFARDLSTRPKRYPAWQTAIQPPKDSPMDLVDTESSEEHPFVELEKKRGQGTRYSQVVGLEGDGVGGDQAWADRTRSAHVSKAPWHLSNSLPYFHLSGPEITTGLGSERQLHYNSLVDDSEHTRPPIAQYMLSASPFGITFDDDDWIAPPHAPRSYQTASVGSWGVTSIGRGFDWAAQADLPILQETPTHPTAEPVDLRQTETERSATLGRKHHHIFLDRSPAIKTKPILMTSTSPQTLPQAICRPITPSIQPLTRSPTSPRPRRRSSQQRVSLIAGRVSIAPIDPPSPTPMLTENLRRTPSSGSILSIASTRPPSPSETQHFLGGRNISEYLIEREIGRGAYGLVKRAREFLPDGSLGVSIPVSDLLSDIFHNMSCIAPVGY